MSEFSKKRAPNGCLCVIFRNALQYFQERIMYSLKQVQKTEMWNGYFRRPVNCKILYTLRHPHQLCIA